MSDNRNCNSAFGTDSRGSVVIDTKRVLDSCRDRDCFENARVYLSSFGEETLSSASNIRARSAKILWAYVGVDDVPFNCGFYRVNVKSYVLVELEACLGIGRSQTFQGLAVLEKEVILYGGEGSVTTFTSDPDSSYCSYSTDNMGTTAPVAIIETVEPIILGTKVVECGCPCSQNEYIEIPENLRHCLGAEMAISTDGPRLYVSLGVFSVIRLVRSAQLLVQASDYSVPDKECVAAENDDDPCALFRTMSFPETSFRGNGCVAANNPGRAKGCGCNR